MLYSDAARDAVRGSLLGDNKGSCVPRKPLEGSYYWEEGECGDVWTVLSVPHSRDIESHVVWSDESCLVPQDEG